MDSIIQMSIDLQLFVVLNNKCFLPLLVEPEDSSQSDEGGSEGETAATKGQVEGQSTSGLYEEEGTVSFLGPLLQVRVLRDTLRALDPGEGGEGV